MKRVISGEDILLAIGEIDEKLLAYPTKAATRATIFKKLAVACVSFAVCAVLAFIALRPGLPTLDKNDGSEGFGDSAMGGVDNENSAPSSPYPPENDNDVSNSIHGALRIEKDGSFENYVQNGNIYLHLRLNDGVLKIMVSTEHEKPTVNITDRSGNTVYNPQDSGSGYYTLDVEIGEGDVIEIAAKDLYSYVFEANEVSDAEATLKVISIGRY